MLKLLIGSLVVLCAPVMASEMANVSSAPATGLKKEMQAVLALMTIWRAYAYKNEGKKSLVLTSVLLALFAKVGSRF